MSTSDRSRFAGVDIGQDRVDAALVEASGQRLRLLSFYTGGLEGLTGFCSVALRVGVDAPGGLSSGAHLGDTSVAPKFRSGRCSEIPVAGVPAVPWVTPSSFSQAPGWMRTGFGAWAALQAEGLSVVEAFPAAVFHRMNGGRWPAPKTTVAGRAERLRLLSSIVALPGALAGAATGLAPGSAPGSAPGWTHDRIDALACAVVAACGRPAPHSCPTPDGSVMWVLGEPSCRLPLESG